MDAVRWLQVHKRDNSVLGVHVTDIELAGFWLQIPFITILFFFTFIFYYFYSFPIKYYSQQLYHAVELILK